MNTVKQVHEFRRSDKVEYEDMRSIILGLRSRGYFVIGTLEWEKTDDSASYKNLRVVEKSKTLMFERRKQHIPLHLVEDEEEYARSS
ncbi:MAG: hypothetical protein WBH69_01920 [Fervidobacterium sp.]